MKPSKNIFLILFILILVSVSAVWGQDKRLAPLLDSHDIYNYPVSTDSTEAQKFFNQGLILSYGFNHAEAERSFREAARLDPDCAMCYWGVALVLGPNINMPMDKSAAPKAYEAIRKARELAPGATEKEQGLIEALSKRYAKNPPEDRKPLDMSYADAMRSLARTYPDDPDISALFAESLLDLHPWDYWNKNGDPKPWTPEILATLEKVLADNQGHFGAIHFYIHATEASANPRKAETYADRLAAMKPGTSHLAHMPSHTYIRIGRYHDAVQANLRALEEDQSYIAQCHAQGVYPLGYMPHNSHFLWYAAIMEGNSALSKDAAERTLRQVEVTMLQDPAWGAFMQHLSLLPLYGSVRFEDWDAILNMSGPSSDLPYPAGIRHFARGMALTKKGQLAGAERELSALEALAADDSLLEVKIWGINSIGDMLRIASQVLAGELAAAKGNYDAAISHLQRGVALQDGLIYIEPADWPYSVRQFLGAVLLKAGRPADAEKAYRQDLIVNPENGWSLFGLAQSLSEQGRHDEAKKVKQQFEKAWVHSDVTLASSGVNKGRSG